MTDILAGLIPEKEETVPDGVVLDFTVSTKVFDRALADVLTVVASKDLIPVLKNIHVKVTEDHQIVLTASDSTLSARSYAKAVKVEQTGIVALPAKRLASVVRESSGDTVRIKAVAKSGKYTTAIRSGKAVWKIPLMDPKTFPTFEGVEDETFHEVNRLGFYEALHRVHKAASDDPMRPYLRMVDVRDGKVRASDSVRFQQAKHIFPFDCQIPVQAIPELLRRLLADTGETFSVGQTDKALLFRFASSLFVTQKVMAKFPDMDEVFMKPTLGNDLKFSASRAELLKAIRRARITADEVTSAIVLSLNHGSVSVESKDRNGSVSVESVDAEWEYAPRHVAFNYQHLLDMLASTDSDTCVFRLGKDLKTRPSPLLMEDTEAGFTAILSQIRLDWV